MNKGQQRDQDNKAWVVALTKSVQLARTDPDPQKRAIGVANLEELMRTAALMRRRDRVILVTNADRIEPRILKVQFVQQILRELENSATAVEKEQLKRNELKSPYVATYKALKLLTQGPKPLPKPPQRQPITQPYQPLPDVPGEKRRIQAYGSLPSDTTPPSPTQYEPIQPRYAPVPAEYVDPAKVRAQRIAHDLRTQASIAAAEHRRMTNSLAVAMSRTHVATSRGPLEASTTLYVEGPSVVLPRQVDVDRALAGVGERDGGGVNVRHSDYGEYGLFATRAFAVGDYVARYDGELLSYARAQQLIDDGFAHSVRTLRAGMWAVFGYTSPSDVPPNGSLGAFSQDNLNVCRTILDQVESRHDDVPVNTQLLMVTDADNASRNDIEFDPRRAHLVLVATRPIAVDDEIFHAFLPVDVFFCTPTPTPALPEPARVDESRRIAAP